MEVDDRYNELFLSEKIISFENNWNNNNLPLLINNRLNIEKNFKEINSLNHSILIFWEIKEVNSLFNSIIQFDL